ncbi:MAG: hypothetical protein P8174_05160 [Gemmatimonadota bacterium]
MGGTVWADSVLGRGTTIAMVLPAGSGTDDTSLAGLQAPDAADSAVR